MKTETDCRSKEGIAVGLIDSMITISRVLTPTLEELNSETDGQLPESVIEALKDLREDEDVYSCMASYIYNPRILSVVDAEAASLIRDAAQLIKSRNVR